MAYRFSSRADGIRMLKNNPGGCRLSNRTWPTMLLLHYKIGEALVKEGIAEIFLHDDGRYIRPIQETVAQPAADLRSECSLMADLTRFREGVEDGFSSAQKRELGPEWVNADLDPNEDDTPYFAGFRFGVWLWNQQ